MNWSEIDGWFNFAEIYDQVLARAADGPVFVDHPETWDGDLAIDGAQLDKFEADTFRRAFGTMQECLTAFHRLLGCDPIRSQVTADT